MAASSYKTVNIEAGMPYVDQAIKRITFEIQSAKRQKLGALKLIHGFGSSGTGGRIRTESRKYFAALANRGEIKFYVEGEKFSIFEECTRRAFAVCPDLRQDKDLERYNNGITFVIL